MLAKFFFILVFFALLALMEGVFTILSKYWTRKNVRRIENEIRKLFTRP